MKRFSLIVVVALVVVVSATAQAKGRLQANAKKVSRTAQAKAPERPVLTVTELNHHDTDKHGLQLPKAAGKRLPTAKQAANVTKMQTRKRVAANRAQRHAAGVMTDQPAGTYHNMVYTCSYYGYSYFYGLYNGTYSGALGEVVEGNDGCLYIHNMLTEMYTEEGYWVKAEKVDGTDDTYVIHEQPIYVEDYYGEIFTYSIMKVVYDAENQTMVPAENTDIEITWKDGTLRTAAEFNDPGSIDTAISAIDDSGYWSNAMNWDVTMTPQTDVAITELPAGVEAKEMVMKYISGYNDVGSEYDEDEEDTEGAESTFVPVEAAEKVKVAVNGGDIYLQYYPGFDSWVKGTVNGNKASFPTGQYLGPDSYYGQHVYFVATDEEDYLLNEVVFDYDPATNRLEGSNATIYANAGKDEVYYISSYTAPSIFPFVEVSATPQPVDQSSMYGYNYDPYFGYGYLYFDVSCFDAEGNYLDTDKLYYKIYVGDDDENAVFTFTPEEYASLESPMTEVPYSYQDAVGDFSSAGSMHGFTTYVNQARNLGIQVIYKGGGEEHASEISWNRDNNGVAGFESVFPEVEEPQVYSELADGEMVIKLGEASSGFGTGRADTESFDVAMKIGDSMTSGATLAGKKIAGVSVPFLATEGVSNAKVWLSTNIGIDADGTFTPDGPSKAFTLTSNGYTTVRFDEPYVIPEEGLYIGYSFTQAYDEELGSAPIILTDYTNLGGFMIHSDKVYRLGWADMAGVAGDLAIEAIMVGGEADAAEVAYIKDVETAVGKTVKTTAKIVNYGYHGLRAIAYDYKLLGYDEEADQEIQITGNASLGDINLPRVFGGYQSVAMDVPAAEKVTDYIFYANVTKANDEDNAIEGYEGQCNVFVLNFVPKKRPLMEEYTGTWCGYCPRGFIGLEKMAELYPEEFIAISYHNADPMEVTTEFPSDVEGFPMAFLDRAWEVDAYYGSYNNDFGIEATWLERCQESGVADIDVEASWSEDQKTINIKSAAKFARNEDQADYRISYAVVADGLTGTGSDWAQANYYSGSESMLYMEQFTEGDSHVSGLVFNDVLVAASAYQGVEGSLPATIVGGTTYTHEFTFNADDILNTAGKAIVQDKDKVKVVAILVSSWGNVYNANRCKVMDALSAISNLNDGADSVVKTEYFDLAGRKVTLPSNGIYVQSQQMKNGNTVNHKVVIK